MPKDPVRNIDRYKIRGGHFNEFDFARHHNEMTHEEEEQFRQGEVPIPSEQTKAERIKRLLTKYGESLPGSAKKKSVAKNKPARKTTSKAAKSTAKPTSKPTSKAAAKSTKKSAAKSVTKKTTSQSTARGKTTKAQSSAQDRNKSRKPSKPSGRK
jgi:hypothetical protein